MSVAFRAADSGTGPLTWGQSAIWEAIGRTAPDDHYFNFGRILKVPGTRTPAEVDAALARLVSVHGALRTRLDLSGARPRQRLAAAGELPVQRCAGGRPEEVLARLTALPFDYEDEWPLRVATVVDGPRVTHVVLAFCHVAADGLGAEVAVRDLRMLLLRGAGAPSGPPAPRPLDLAAWQAGSEGRRAAGRAARLWEKVPREVMFDRRAGAGERPRVWRGSLVSRAMDLAVRAVAARHRTSTSTVLLAATAAMVARSAGRERCTVLPIASNRFRRDTARLVGMVSQEGVFTLEGLDRPFGVLLGAAEPAALRAYRSAFHDPVDRERGAWVQPLCCFNDQRLAKPEPAHCPPEEIRAALPGTRLTWPLGQDRLNCRFCVHVSGNLEISVTADTAFLPRARIEGFLYGMESLLVAEALRAADR